MLVLKRRLYRLILRLHPASFRNRFAREMSLDFEDALATYGFSRLLADATHSLLRQWTTPVFSPSREQAPIPSHPLLAGHYMPLTDQPLTPVELLRGSLLFAILFFMLSLAFNARTNRIISGNLQGLPANQNTAMASVAAGAFQTPYNPNYQRSRVSSSANSATSGRPFISAGVLVPGTRGPLVVGHGNPPPAPRGSWIWFILPCVLISAIIWIASLLLRRTQSAIARVAVVSLSVFAIVIAAAFVPVQPPPARAQSRPGVSATPVAFDVISIREDKSLAPSTIRLQPMTRDGYHFRSVPLFALLQEAYAPSQSPLLNFRPGQIIGAPDWLSSSRYDIDAKVSEADIPAWNDPERQRAMRHALLQSLLADRLKLVAHRETRTMPIFELTVGKAGARFGPNLKLAAPLTPDEIRKLHPEAITLGDGTLVASGPNPGQQTLFGVTMQTFAWFITNTAGRPVRDNTGLTGKYDISYQLELLPPQQEGSGPAPPSPYSMQIHSIVEDQLGLKLVPTKAPVEVLVIDHIERPSEN